MISYVGENCQLQLQCKAVREAETEEGKDSRRVLQRQSSGCHTLEGVGESKNDSSFVDFFRHWGNDGSLLSRHVFSMAACFAASGGRARGIESERFRVNTPGQKTFNFDSGFSLRSCRHLLCKRDDVALSCTKGCAAACNQSRGGRALQRCRAAITCASGYVLAAVRVARQAGGSTLRGAPGMHDACAAIKAGAGQPESCPGATQLRV